MAEVAAMVAAIAPAKAPAMVTATAAAAAAAVAGEVVAATIPAVVEGLAMGPTRDTEVADMAPAAVTEVVAMEAMETEVAVEEAMGVVEAMECQVVGGTPRGTTDMTVGMVPSVLLPLTTTAWTSSADGLVLLTVPVAAAMVLPAARLMVL